MLKLHSLGKKIIREMLAATKVVSRQRKETLREVFIAPPNFVYKRYEINRFSLFYVKPWIAEAQALMKVQGCKVPQHIDLFAGKNDQDNYEIIHKKTYIDGDVIRHVGQEQACQIGKLVASIHARMVVSRDPQKKNFYLGNDGDIYLIDFGKARTYWFKSPLYLYDVASEFAKLERLVFESRKDLWLSFQNSYFKALPTAKPVKAIIQSLFYLCAFTRNVRRGKLSIH